MWLAGILGWRFGGSVVGRQGPPDGLGDGSSGGPARGGSSAVLRQGAKLEVSAPHAAAHSLARSVRRSPFSPLLRKTTSGRTMTPRRVPRERVRLHSERTWTMLRPPSESVVPRFCGRGPHGGVWETRTERASAVLGAQDAQRAGSDPDAGVRANRARADNGSLVLLATCFLRYLRVFWREAARPAPKGGTDRPMP